MKRPIRHKLPLPRETLRQLTISELDFRGGANTDGAPSNAVCTMTCIGCQIGTETSNT
jgi:hypothetical protein